MVPIWYLTIHVEPSGNIEDQGMLKLFEPSHEKVAVKCNYYIEDGEAKNYKRVVEAQPYDQDYKINKKKCVGHVHKEWGDVCVI